MRRPPGEIIVLQRRNAAIAAIVLALACNVLPAAAQETSAQETPATVAAKLRDAAVHDEWGYRFLERLTSEIGQRLAGTEAMTRAAAMAQRELTAAGFENVHAEPFPMTAWVRGVETAEIVAPAPQRLVVTALGGSVATPAGGIDAEVALFRTWAEFLAAPPQSLTGKIAVVTQRMVRAEDGGGYGAANPIRRAGPAEAAKRGAIAYLHRSLGTDNHRLAHTGATNYTADAPRIPAAALANPDADQLERLAALGPVKLHLVLTPTSNESATSMNVVGEIKGRERPDDIVLIGAHLDSWDLGTGAIDDGAGVAIVSAAGRLIAALPRHPKRTVRVVLFGAEEMDYSGAAYAKAHAAEAGHIALAGETDFGARKIYMLAAPAGSAKSEFTRMLGETLVPLGIFLGREPALFSGDDVRGLQAAGVPVIAMRQNGLDYFDIHHTADDTFDKIEPGELAQNIAAWTAMAYLAAETDTDFRALAAPPR
jgi:hypothetical protein